jgi:phosphate transport system substrate-binding protein
MRNRRQNPLLFAVALCGFGALSASAAEMPSYEPRAVEFPTNASYVQPDGSIYIVGNDGMEAILKQFNDLFAKTHPGFRFKMLLKGSSTGIGGLTAGVSAFAPMGREAWGTDASGFREVYGSQPFDIHIGYDGFVRPKHKNPPAIYVNAKNPLAGLTLEELTRVFTSGHPKGDLTQWKQLGLGGEWAKHALQVYGQPDDGGSATSIRRTKLGGRPFAYDYNELEKPCDVVKAVAENPYAIGLASFCEAATVSSNVRLLPLAGKTGEPFVGPSYEDIRAGKYPLAVHLRLYAVRAPGKPLDPLVKEYARLVLSKEGQAIIAAQKDSDEGFVPLNASELVAQLAALD